MIGQLQLEIGSLSEKKVGLKSSYCSRIMCCILSYSIWVGIIKIPYSG